MATRKVEHYTGTRITVHSAKTFDSTMSKLYSSIGPVENAVGWGEIMKGVTSYSASNKEAFIAGVHKYVGPHGFMIFREFDHGAWVPLFSVGDGLKCKRIILGNPLIAITMLKHDMTAGLAVPVELLILENKRGGVDVIYHLPSGLIAGLNRDENLVEAVDELNRKLEALVDFVVS